MDRTNVPHHALTIYPLLSIHISSISYQVLLPHDIFRLKDDFDMVLVVDMNSYGFQKSIEQYIDNSVLVDHSREHDGFIKYKFMIKVDASSIQDHVSNGSINDAVQVLRYNQGGGLTLISTQYKGIKYLV